MTCATIACSCCYFWKRNYFSNYYPYFYLSIWKQTRKKGKLTYESSVTLLISSQSPSYSLFLPHFIRKVISVIIAFTLALWPQNFCWPLPPQHALVENFWKLKLIQYVLISMEYLRISLFFHKTVIYSSDQLDSRFARKSSFRRDRPTLNFSIFEVRKNHFFGKETNISVANRELTYISKF